MSVSSSSRSDAVTSSASLKNTKNSSHYPTNSSASYAAKLHQHQSAYHIANGKMTSDSGHNRHLNSSIAASSDLSYSTDSISHHSHNSTPLISDEQHRSRYENEQNSSGEDSGETLACKLKSELAQSIGQYEQLGQHRECLERDNLVLKGELMSLNDAMEERRVARTHTQSQFAGARQNASFLRMQSRELQNQLVFLRKKLDLMQHIMQQQDYVTWLVQKSRTTRRQNESDENMGDKEETKEHHQSHLNDAQLAGALSDARKLAGESPELLAVLPAQMTGQLRHFRGGDLAHANTILDEKVEHLLDENVEMEREIITLENQITLASSSSTTITAGSSTSCNNKDDATFVSSRAARQHSAIQKSKAEISSLKSSNQILSQREANCQSELARLQEELDQLKSANDALETKERDMKEERRKIRRELTEVKDQCEDLVASNNRMARQITQLSSRNSAVVLQNHSDQS